jgi:dihydroorotase-like cyclic amidohydrolase
MEQTVLIKGGTVVTMDAAETVFEGDVLVRGSRIESVGRASCCIGDGRRDD